MLGYVSDLSLRLQKLLKSEYLEKLGNCTEHTEKEVFGCRFVTWNLDWQKNIICGISLALTSISLVCMLVFCFLAIPAPTIFLQVLGIFILGWG